MNRHKVFFAYADARAARRPGKDGIVPHFLLLSLIPGNVQPGRSECCRFITSKWNVRTLKKTVLKDSDLLKCIKLSSNYNLLFICNKYLYYFQIIRLFFKFLPLIHGIIYKNNMCLFMYIFLGLSRVYLLNKCTYLCILNCPCLDYYKSGSPS
jgi:hypothetical protein